MFDGEADLRIDSVDIAGEQVKQANLVGYWNAQLYDAEIAARQGKISFDAYEAELSLVVRESLKNRAKADGERVTEDRIDREIRRHANWGARKLEYHKLELRVNWIKGHIMALTQKKDMLVSLAHGNRQELRSLTSLAA